MAAPRRAARRRRRSSSRPARARPAVRPAPAHGWSRSRRQGARPALLARARRRRRPAANARDGEPGAAAATSLRRLERFRAFRAGPANRRSDGRLPQRAAAASPELAERLARRVDGEVVATPPGRFVRVEAPRDPAPGRPRPAGELPGQPPADAPWSASTPRRRASPPPPGRSRSSSASAGGRADASGRSSCCSPTTPTSRRLARALADASRRRLARDLQRPRLRLAAARRALPDGAADPPRSTPATSTCCRSSAGSSATGWTDARLRSVEAELLGLRPPWRRRRLGDPRALPRLPARRSGAGPLVDVVRHNDEDVRSLARLLGHVDAGYATAERAARRAAGRPRRPRPRVRARAATRRRWPASTRPSHARWDPSRAPTNPEPPPERARPPPASRERTTTRGGRRARAPDFGGRPGRSVVGLAAADTGRRRSRRGPSASLDRARLLRRLGASRRGGRLVRARGHAGTARAGLDRGREAPRAPARRPGGRHRGGHAGWPPPSVRRRSACPSRPGGGPRRAARRLGRRGAGPATGPADGRAGDPDEARGRTVSVRAAGQPTTYQESAAAATSRRPPAMAQDVGPRHEAGPNTSPPGRNHAGSASG